MRNTHSPETKAGPRTGWVAVDWGTSNLRIWLMADDSSLIERRTSPRGMGSLQPDEFEPVLLDLIADVLDNGPLPIVCCGMVGARQGWREAPYAQAPCQPPSIESAVRPSCRDPRIDVRILPGVKQISPPDVMRGEETQIAGLLAAEPDFNGAACLPGTHSKWVRIEMGTIVSFRTFMTGELFALLSSQSVLKHSVAAEGGDDDAFLAAVSDVGRNPGALTAKLFGIRADALVNGMASGVARARLSGLLIGAEIAAARELWDGREIRMIGDSGIARAYAQALEHLGGTVRIACGKTMTLEGLKAARARF